MHIDVNAKRRSDESGTILIVTLLVLLVVSSIGVGVVIVAGSEGDLSGNMKAGEQALYFADAGLAEALSQIDVSTSGGVPNGFGVAKAQILPVSGIYADVKGPSGAVIPDAKYRVEGEMDAGSNGFTVECNIPGYSLDYGQRRFHLISTGVGAGGTVRQVEAVIISSPTPGICPPGLGEQH